MNGKILGYLSLSLVCGAALLAQNWKPIDKAWTDKRAPELTVTGRVVDTSGHPIPDATIMVYHAGVLNGYSTFCPSCYRDCGKRATTDAAGNYVIGKLDSRLWFDLLVVRDGYAPEIVKVKNPSVGTVPLTTLNARPPAPDPSHVVKGMSLT